MNRSVLEAIRTARRKRQSLALVTELGSGAQTLVYERGPDGPITSTIAGGKSGTITLDNGAEAFVQLFVPSPRLVLVGAVHIAQKLVPLAQQAEFLVTVVDPRQAFATEARFPGVELAHAWPDKALESLALDAGTAVVTLTHDPKLDDPGLVAALKAPCFYVGALGSRKTHGRRLDRLKAEGFGDADLARIHAPVGLPIGAVSPAEIALSILAEIVAVRRGRSLGSVS